MKLSCNRAFVYLFVKLIIDWWKFFSIIEKEEKLYIYIYVLLGLNSVPQEEENGEEKKLNIDQENRATD